MADRSCKDGKRRRPGLVRFLLGLLLVAAIASFIWLLAGKASVRPDRSDCPVLRENDDLVHLARRATGTEARAQLARWSSCDQLLGRTGEDTLAARARDTFQYDYVLIGTVSSVVVVAALVMRRQRRWRLAGTAGVALGVAFAAADVVEDIQLDRILKDANDWSSLLPIASAVKFGALIGALPLVCSAVFVLFFGEPVGDRAISRQQWKREARDDPKPARRFLMRWTKRLRSDVPDPEPVGVTVSGPVRPPTSGSVAQPNAGGGIGRGVRSVVCRIGKWLCGAACGQDPPASSSQESTDPSGLGICCSGGGIRSAAFSLGALQALDELPPGKGASEISRARWLFAVSGGSYIAAAWVTARSAVAKSDATSSATGRRPWSRRSAEETFLRRHASYLAPGLAGKAWAVYWFLLTFAVNAGVIVLTIGAFFLPAGWLIHTAVETRPVDSGVVSLPAGGCVALEDGSFLAAAAGTTLQLSPGSTVVPTRGLVEQPKEVGEGKATATAEGPPPLVAVATVGELAAQTPPGADAGVPVSCPASPSPGEDDGQLPANAPGRVFEKGTTVPILPGEDVGVQSTARVTGCVSTTRPAVCPISDAAQHVVGRGSRLVTAPAVRLTLPTRAIVFDDADPDLGSRRLEEACGTGRCARLQVPWGLSWFLGGAVAIAGLSGVALVTMRNEEAARKKVQLWVKRLALGAGVLVALFWAMPHLVLFLGRGRSFLERWAGVVSGAGGGTIVLALLSQLRAASGKSTSPDGKVQSWLKSVGARLRPVLLRLAAVLAGPMLLLLAAALFAAHGASLSRDHDQITLGLVLVGWLVIFGSCGDLNRWSLHPYYRERLRSAFAVDINTGQPRPDERLADLPGAPDPQLVLCATANLANGRITPPGRPALPWTFSADGIGSYPGTGRYHPNDVPDRFEDLGSVWTSVAVSGAAFAPAMGKMSRPERFLFALGNLRLGVWYPNPLFFQDDPPDDFDRSWYERHHPRPWYLFKEAFGLHKLRDPWVYVTDGGHYENLGLVELLRSKKCREVYCFDAAGDSTMTFGTFADARRLAREEHQIEIDLDPRAMRSLQDEDGVSKVGVWAGTIRYPDAPPGWIVVAKLTVPVAAPFDIVDLARTLPSFPTHPTADQLYTDQKFEAYRALGHYLGAQAVGAGTELRKLVACRKSYEEAVAIVNTDLCKTKDPHPCPPEKRQGTVEKKTAAKDAKDEDKHRAAHRR